MYLDSRFAWQDDLSQDDLLSRNAMWNYCENNLDKWQMIALSKDGRERKGKSKGARQPGELRGRFESSQSLNRSISGLIIQCTAWMRLEA